MPPAPPPSHRVSHPRFGRALLADARATAAYRGERFEFRSTTDALIQAGRLALVSDAFLAQALYRAEARLRALRVPVLPRMLHRLAVTSAGVCIGEQALVHPGVYIVHGQVIIDGRCEIHPGVALSPWVTIGPGGDGAGPTIGPGVSVGTGACILGRLRVGARARIGANSVVLVDVPPRATTVGIPARIAPAAPGD